MSFCIFKKIRQLGEQETKTLLTEYEKYAPGVMKQSNVDAITDTLPNRSDQTSVLKQLLELQASHPEITNTDN